MDGQFFMPAYLAGCAGLPIYYDKNLANKDQPRIRQHLLSSLLPELCHRLFLLTYKTASQKTPFQGDRASFIGKINKHTATEIQTTVFHKQCKKPSFFATT
jgi:hypothetical protein